MQKPDDKGRHRSKAVLQDRGRHREIAEVAVLGLFIKHSVLHLSMRTEAAHEFSFRRYTKILADILGITKDLVVYVLMSTEAVYTQCYE